MFRKESTDPSIGVHESVNCRKCRKSRYRPRISSMPRWNTKCAIALNPDVRRQDVQQHKPQERTIAPARRSAVACCCCSLSIEGSHDVIFP